MKKAVLEIYIKNHAWTQWKWKLEEEDRKRNTGINIPQNISVTILLVFYEFVYKSRKKSWCSFKRPKRFSCTKTFQIASFNLTVYREQCWICFLPSGAIDHCKLKGSRRLVASNEKWNHSKELNLKIFLHLSEGKFLNKIGFKNEILATVIFDLSVSNEFLIFVTLRIYHHLEIFRTQRQNGKPNSQRTDMSQST